MKKKLLFFLLLLTFDIKGQTMFYVADNGSDNNVGINIENPFKTINKAFESISSNSDSIITSSYTIKLLYGQTGNVKFWNSNKEFVWWKSGNNMHKIIIESHDINRRVSIIRNSEIIDQNTYALVLKKVENIELKNLIFKEGMNSIALRSAKNCRIIKCVFNVNDYFLLNGGGVVSIGKGDYESEYNYIEEDTFNFNEESVYDFAWFDRIVDPNGPNGWHKYDMYHAIYLSNTDNNIIRFNVINNPSGCGIHINETGSSFNKIYNNKFYMLYNHDYKVKTPKVENSITKSNRYYGENCQWNFPIDESRSAILLYDTSLNSIGNEFKNNHFYYTRKLKYRDTIHYKSPYNNNLIAIFNKVYDHQIYSNNTFEFVPNDYDVAFKRIEAEKRYYDRYKRKSNKLIRLPNGRNYYVIQEKGIVLKLSSLEFNPDNLFGLNVESGRYTGSNLIGAQYFNRKITDMKYIDGYFFVGFEDGWIIKVREESVSNNQVNMFSIGDLNKLDTLYNNTFLGSYKFKVGTKVNDIYYISNLIFISLSDGQLLKIQNYGGICRNLFALQLDNDSNYISLAEYNYLIGQARFSKPVCYMLNLNNPQVTFICLENCNILKVSGTGGLGRDMFNVSEVINSCSAFTTSNNNYNVYRLGDAKFSGKVTYAYNNGTFSLFCFDNGKILKVKGNNGSGGNGCNMFALTETENGFMSLPSFNYFAGSHIYDAYVVSFVYENPYTYLLLNDGKIINNIGFGDESTSMFSGNNYYGNQFFMSSPSDLTIINGSLYISLLDGRVFKVDTGTNLEFMYNLSVTVKNHFKHFPDRTNYISGFQDLKINEIENNEIQSKVITVSEPIYETQENIANVFPNPADELINIELNLKNSSTVFLELYDLNGLLSNYKKEEYAYGNVLLKLNLSNISKGVYVLRVKINDKIHYYKIIKK